MKKIKIFTTLVLLILIALFLFIRFGTFFDKTETNTVCNYGFGYANTDACFDVIVYKNINNKLFCYLKGETWRRNYREEGYACLKTKNLNLELE